MNSSHPAISSIHGGIELPCVGSGIAEIAGIAASLKNEFGTLFFMGLADVPLPIQNTPPTAIPAIPAIYVGVDGGLAFCWRVLPVSSLVRGRSSAVFLQMSVPKGGSGSGYMDGLEEDD